jgi:hypothetical protein
VKKLIAFLLCAVAAEAGPKLVSLKTIPAEATLHYAGSAQQFLAIATYADGGESDVTGEVRWQVSNAALARVLDGGRLSAIADGSLTISAALPGGARADSRVTIADSQVARPFSFARDIGGIFTKRGCNQAACHGGVKGRGGLKLSANALYPKDDYEWITKGGAYQVLTAEVKGERIPRVDIKNPEASLLLTKPTMATPHGGGKRLDKDSDDYNAVLAWVKSGAPYGAASGNEPELTRLEIYPAMAAMPVEGHRRLLVTGHFKDGHREDFTRQVLYASNNADVAEVSADGVVSGKRLGETAVLIRGVGQVSSAGVGVIGPAIPNYPEIPRWNFIDEAVFGKLRKFHILPSGVADDGEFLRRVCLDLTGTLPPPERVRQFIASSDARKREKVIDALLASPEFVDYWTFRFSDVFRVAIFANGLTPKWSQKYWEWIRSNIETNRPYDEVARERLSAQGYGAASRHFLPYNQIGPPADVMAEEVRVFMGRRLDCAQCHNHPYENWSQDQFWGMAAYFSRLFKMGPVVFDHPTTMDLGSKDVDGKIQLVHPRTKAPVEPVALDGYRLRSPELNPREELARWITGHPYFAEAAVNRIWGQFFGRGIVDPVDDFRSTNPPTHPDLLAALAKDFREHGYNLRQLMKTIVMSRTYQLSHLPNTSNREDVVNYSHSLPRTLDAEVLLDGVVDVTGVPETFSTAVTEGSSVGQAPAGTRAINLKDPDMYFSRFLELYGRPNRGAIPERSVHPNLGQALHMLAGESYAGRLSSKDSRLARLLEFGASDVKVFEEFYLAAFARLPERDEVQELQKILEKRGDRAAGLREFVWALISSREFAENH